jgi:hypothetical protein
VSSPVLEELRHQSSQPRVARIVMEALVPVLLDLELRDVDRKGEDSDVGELAAGGGEAAGDDD